MDFWESLKSLIPIDIPEYLRKILSSACFDNYLSLESLDDNIMAKLTKIGKAQGNECVILLGHKIMLFRIRDIIRDKGIEAVTKHVATQSTKKLFTSPHNSTEPGGTARTNNA